MSLSSYFRRSRRVQKTRRANHGHTTRRPRFESLENRRLLSFTPGSSYTGVGGFDLVAADFNDDGQPDLAASDLYGNSVNVLLGNRDGTFQSVPPLATGPYPSSLAVGYFNADTNLDLVTANTDEFGVGDEPLSLLLGNGSGGFAPAVSRGSGLPEFPVAVASGHLNVDQNLDLVVVSDDFFGNHQLSVLLGDGAGNFSHHATYGGYNVGQLRSPVLAYFNQDDSHIDVVVSDWQSGSVQVFLGNGDGTLQAPRDFATGIGGDSVAVGDFNGDDNVDLAATTAFDDPVKVLLGNGDGTFQPAQPFAAGTDPHSVKAADVSGDGNVDLIVTNGEGVSVLLGRGDGSFIPPITIATGGSSIALADFNNDDRLDAAVSSSIGVSVLINDGDWPVVPPTPPPASIFVSDASVTEGRRGIKYLTFTVSLSEAATGPVTADFATQNGTAIAGSDYQSQSGTLTFAAGETTKTVRIAIFGDSTVEPDESFQLILSNATGNAVISDPLGVGLILNDDVPRGGGKKK